MPGRKRILISAVCVIAIILCTILDLFFPAYGRLYGGVVAVAGATCLFNLWLLWLENRRDSFRSARLWSKRK